MAAGCWLQLLAAVLPTRVALEETGCWLLVVQLRCPAFATRRQPRVETLLAVLVQLLAAGFASMKSSRNLDRLKFFADCRLWAAGTEVEVKVELELEVEVAA